MWRLTPESCGVGAGSCDLLNAPDTTCPTLSGLIPICAACKKVRDDQGYWQQVEEYVSAHAEVEFSHGLCPDCMAKLYPDAALSDGRGVDDAESGATDDTP